MESATLLNNSGIALTEANRPKEAIPLFLEALVMEPINPLLWFNLGIAQQKTGDYEEAIISFRRAIDIDDDLAEAWVSLGLIAYETKNIDLAEDCYLAALIRNDIDPKTWNNLGVLYFTSGKMEEARQSFEKAVCLLPHYPEALLNLRDVCREMGDFVAAAEFERVLSGITESKSSPARQGAVK